MNTLVFVYGTLKKGHGNHGLIAGFINVDHSKYTGENKFVGHDKILGRIYSLGGFPGLKEHPDGKVHGEVYEVDAPTLERLDRLEGHPHMYERRLIETVEGKKVWTYFYNGNVDNRHFIRSGIW